MTPQNRKSRRAQQIGQDPKLLLEPKNGFSGVTKFFGNTKIYRGCWNHGMGCLKEQLKVFDFEHENGEFLMKFWMKITLKYFVQERRLVPIYRNAVRKTKTQNIHILVFISRSSFF